MAIRVSGFDSETRSWNDSSLIPDPTLDYQYRLYAYAAKNTSAPKSITVAALFPAPDSLQMENAMILATVCTGGIIQLEKRV